MFKIFVVDFFVLIVFYGWLFMLILWCYEGFWIECDDEEVLLFGSIVEYLSGLFYIQEVSLMLLVVVLFVDDNYLQWVMDMVVVSGFKIMQIVVCMGNCGIILVNEFLVSCVKVLYVNIS